MQKNLWKSLPIADVKAIGLKFAGFEGESFLWIKIILPEHHIEGDSCDSNRILENSVAKKCWQEGRRFRKKYEMPSDPGEEVEEHFFNIHLIALGVIGETSYSSMIVGEGILS